MDLYSPTSPRTLRPLAGIATLAFGVGNAFAQSTATNAGSQLSFDAAGVQWQRTEQLELPNVTGNVPITTNQAAGLLARVPRFQPIVTTPGDLASLLTREAMSPAFTVQDMLERMQVVPGLPADPRYQQPKFQPVRDAFSQGCQASASSYRSLAANLFQSLSTSASVSTLIAARPTSYDGDCLKGLDAVPDAIQRVVGLLTDRKGKAFCTATIVGRDSIITSRHCFTDADSGKPTAYQRQLLAEEIVFQTLMPHGARTDFTLAAPAPNVLAQKPFGAGQDYVVLQIKTWQLEHWATVNTAPLTNDRLPLAAWIVGSSTLISNAGEQRTPRETVRGSPPMACAILETTSAGCMYHSCQTSPATSGAGVLSYDSVTGVRLLGVHKGPTARAESCEAAAPVSLTLNLAATILQSQLSGAP